MAVCDQLDASLTDLAAARLLDALSQRRCNRPT
jgi:hypothetical protein